MYAKIKNGQVQKYPIDNIRIELPNVSFPNVITQENLPEGYVQVEPAALPQYNPRTHSVIPAAPVNQNGRWVTSHTVVALNPQEISERAFVLAAQVRSERNQKLADSDWTQVLDSQVDRTDWARYRQDLRDITNQQNFPWAVEWPVAP